MTLCLAGCGARSPYVSGDGTDAVTETKDVHYSREYKVEYADDYPVVTIEDQRILIVPEGREVPVWAGDDMTIIRQPVRQVYVAASSVPDMIDKIGALERVRYTSTKYEDWGIDSMKNALDDEKIAYVGKYSAPDYEYILSNGCDLVIESTMILHSPETKEKLCKLGMPVIIDYSSYESDPLARLEWIRLYGLIFGKEETADAFFKEKEAAINALEDHEDRKTVAFFYITGKGQVVVRKPGDYVAKMIDMAGGKYVITTRPEDENALSTMNMQMEAFYAEAVDADILIYNSTIEGEIDTVDELIAKNKLLGDFKAVKNGDVYCTGKNMYQETSSMADMIEEIHDILSESSKDDYRYFHRLK